MPLSPAEVKRRADAIEGALKDGFAPFKEHGGRGSSVEEAARRLGNVKKQTLVGQINDATLSPDWKLYQPPTVEAPEGYKVTGRSTLYNMETGEPVLEWVKTSAAVEQAEKRLQAMFEGFRDKTPPANPVKAPKVAQTDLMNLFLITDYHMGMLAWPEETGDAWDTKIAETILINWFREAIDRAPLADVAVFGQLGDFLHWDGMEAVTPTNRNLLDADTRFQHLVRVVIRCLLAISEMLLAKYPKVHIIVADANHDPASGVWLREWLATYFAKEPRLSVDTRPDTYYCYECGDVSLFFHHGHRKKLNEVSEVFAAKFREVFGRTKFSYGHTGHLHHKEVKEKPLMIVEQHPTLAAKDAYAAKHGYLAMRSASVITYHKKYGEVGRVTLTPEMVA